MKAKKVRHQHILIRQTPDNLKHSQNDPYIDTGYFNFHLKVHTKWETEKFLMVSLLWLGYHQLVCPCEFITKKHYYCAIKSKQLKIAVTSSFPFITTYYPEENQIAYKNPVKTFFRNFWDTNMGTCGEQVMLLGVHSEIISAQFLISSCFP